jgi:bifunctional enzyme CysN/CysC
MHGSLAPRPAQIDALASTQVGLEGAAPANAEARARASESGGATAGLLRFITCGSVDDGKSTLIGRLLYDSRLLLDDQVAALEKESRKYGTQGAGLDFALLVDGLSAEREQGITIDVAYRYFSTPRRSFIVADTPGHEQYTRNMATGASTAELAVILVDARKGLLPQTRRHSLIVSMLGVRHVILAVNKMDLVDYSQARFEEIAEAYRKSAEGLSFATITPIPISATVGENVAVKSRAMSWYAGPPLLEHLETIDVEANCVDSAFRFPVQWVNRPDPSFRGYAGTIVSGTVRPGARVGVWPSGQYTTVSEIVTADGALPRADAGQSVTLRFADEIDVSRGDVVVGNDAAVRVASRLKARLLWLADAPLRKGTGYYLKLGTKTVPASVARLHAAIDVESYAEVRAETIEANGVATATVALESPLVFTDYRQNRELGAFILIDRLSNDTVALGLVEGTLDGTEAGEGAWRRLAAGAAHLAGRLAAWINGTRERPLRSIVKAITWRATGSVDTFVLSFVFTGNIKVSAAISLAEVGTKLMLYYVHERAWAHVTFGLKRGR